MFITWSHQLELPPFIGGRPDPDARFWRSVGLVHQQPFFLATFERGVTGDKVLESRCIVWESDLLLEIGADASRLVDLLYLAPPWCAGTNAWTARPVASVWVGSYKGVEVPVLVDADGKEFCVDLSEIGQNDLLGRRLIADIARVRGEHADA